MAKIDLFAINKDNFNHKLSQSREMIVTAVTNNEYSKSKRIKNRVKEMILDSTSHGLPNFFRTDKKCLKIMWLSFFIVCVVISIFLITKDINQYLEYEVVTQIDIINEYPMQFPTISFQFYRGNFIANYSLEENIVNLIYSNSRRKNISGEFEKLNSDLFGDYYKFNSGKNMLNKSISFKNQTTSGQLGGLDIEIFIGRPNEFIFPYDSLGFHISYFAIYVHNNTINSIESIDNPIKLSTGFKTDLVISKVYTDRLPLPYNDCIDDLNELKTYDSLLVKYILTKTKSIYRQKDCLNLCKTQYVIENCNYSSLQIGFSWEVESQINILNESFDCYDKKFEEFALKNIIKYCSSSCPLECDSFEYNIEFLSTVFPSEIYAKVKLMNNPKIKSKYPSDHNITLEDLRSSMVGFNVYFNNFQYTQIKQLPKKEIVDIIAGFGGTLGLFVGLSFLSFVEFIQIIYEIFAIYFENNQSIQGLS